MGTTGDGRVDALANVGGGEVWHGACTRDALAWHDDFGALGAESA